MIAFDTYGFYIYVCKYYIFVTAKKSAEKPFNK